MTNRFCIKLKRTVGVLLAVIILAVGSAVVSYAYDDETIASASDKISDFYDAGELLDGKQVYVGGTPFGVKLYTDGLLVIGFEDVDCSSGSIAPAKDAGIKLNDIIVEAGGKKIRSAEDFIGVIEKSDGDPVHVVFVRDKARMECDITPAESAADGRYKTGMWLRDSTAGIGTVTFVVPECGVFAGLGHGICDSETGALIPLSRGLTSGVVIGGIKKGAAGAPGELKGSFKGEKTGNLLANTENGVFGIFNDDRICGDELIKIGLKDEMTDGEAYIISTIDGGKPQKYTAVISDIHRDSTGNKNFIITVTDKTLIAKTGGIVQGMSGSPIVQNGKLVGAVTHVLVGDPTKGYGIFIENMIAAAE